MQKAVALFICSLYQGALATSIAKNDDPKVTANPCLSAVLSVDSKIVTDIPLPLGQQVLVASQIKSKPDCPFDCKTKLEKRDILSSFDKASGDLVLFTNNSKYVGTEIDFTITCESALSKSRASYSSWIDVIDAAKPKVATTTPTTDTSSS